MTQLSSLLTNGGKILIVGGYTKAWDSFKKYDQLEFWSGEQKDIVKFVRDREIPANCKGVIISRFISHSELGIVMNKARARNLTVFANKADGEITSLLDQMTLHLREQSIQSSNGNHAVKKIGEKGKLNALIPFLDFAKTNVENARALLIKAKELGIETTEMSLSQWTMIQRKKRSGQTGVVKSVKSKLDLSVDMLDAMIRDLEGMRDYLIAITEENRVLKTKLDKFKKAFTEIE